MTVVELYKEHMFEGKRKKAKWGRLSNSENNGGATPSSLTVYDRV
jgi:hypothetical protein